ncbi:Hypothetical predicted protein [Mytilus galloprovincialis]|uniref:BIRC2_3 n=1 Tax=Mytilus galloprovincialis TaxID=29158 RepID=A0A8B6DK93_MYTGA|nr:Hypothetical predicted protein [Mytilus galloprovincialis]
MYDVFIVYDDKDVFTQETLVPVFENQKLEYCSFYDFPGKTKHCILESLDPFPDKILVVISDELCQNEMVKYAISVVLSYATHIYGNASKMFGHVISFITTGSITIKNSLFQLSETTIIDYNSTTAIKDLVSKIRLKLMPFCNILSKNGIAGTLSLNGLSIQHLHSQIFGLIISTQKLCLQIDLDEYFRYRQKHQDHKTVDVLGQSDVLRSPETKVLILLNNNSIKYKKAVSNISNICSTLIGYSSDFKRWKLACSVAGKYGSAEENFLINIYPNVWYEVTRKAVTNIAQPRFERYSSLNERKSSFPKVWKDNDSDKVEKIADAGFFYPGVGYNGQCYSCGCFISNIQYHKTLHTYHASQYPECKFIKQTLSEDEIQNAISQFNNVDKKLSIASYLEEIYCTFESRLETFNRYNISVLDVNRIAEAGFYCVALNIIQCFKCCVRLFHIPQNENIWAIHANISPKCPYIYEKKGKEFISCMQDSKKNSICRDKTIITIKGMHDSTQTEAEDDNSQTDTGEYLFRPW